MFDSLFGQIRELEAQTRWSSHFGFATLPLLVLTYRSLSVTGCNVLEQLVNWRNRISTVVEGGVEIRDHRPFSYLTSLDGQGDGAAFYGVCRTALMVPRKGHRIDTALHT